MNANLSVRELMDVKVHTVPPDMPLADLDQEFLDKQVSGFPVVEDGKLLGVVSRSDVVRQLALAQQLAERTSDFYWDHTGFHEERIESIQQIATRVGQQIENLRVRDMMSPHAVVVSPDDSVEVAAEKFLQHRVHRAPVVEAGRLVGLITTLDFVSLFAEHRVKVV